jgi:hypothetical protein
MEKEVKIALIGGIFALLVTAIQYGPDSLDAIESLINKYLVVNKSLPDARYSGDQQTPGVLNAIGPLINNSSNETGMTIVIPENKSPVVNEPLPDARYSGDQQTTAHRAPTTKNYKIWADTTEGEFKTRGNSLDGYGTNDGEVNITLYGEYGNISTGILDTKGKKLDVGTNRSFIIYNKKDISNIKEIKINYKGKNVHVLVGKYYDSWHPKQIVIENLANNKSWTFKINKWMEGGLNGPYVPEKPV